jgi:hypothetical protein
MKKQNCVLIGKDNLLKECGNILVSKGHNITAVISQNAAIEHWATALIKHKITMRTMVKTVVESCQYVLIMI